jgi:hypothetical protein
MEKRPAVGARGRIIVITDGYNCVSTGTRMVPADVAVAWKRASGVSIDLIGLNLDADAPQESKRDRAELLGITGPQEQRVHIRDTLDMDTLRETLKESAGVVQFAIIENERVLAELPVGRKWTADAADWLPPQPPRRHTVIVNRQQPPRILSAHELMLEGGEALVLSLGGEPPRLRHVRWTGRTGNDLLREEDQGPLRVSFPWPITQPKTYRIFVSCQAREPGAFTPRPKSVWIEIRPFSDGAPVSRDVFLFTEPMYEPGWPVPVINCEIDRSLWPTEAPSAEVRVWLKQEPASVKSWALAELKIGVASDAAPSEGLRIIRMADETGEQSRTIRLQLQQEPTTTVDNFVPSLTPAPDRIRRTVRSRTARQATVEFEYVYATNPPDTDTVTVHLGQKELATSEGPPVTEVVLLPR